MAPTEANRYDETLALAYAAGWTDGLPIVPPTTERVRAFVYASGRSALEVVGEIPPRGGRATVEKLAANAVMAGCLPEHFQVVIAAIEALLLPRFNLASVQCSTHIATPLVVVNGPIAAELGMNAGGNCFGQGNRANATIGRAVKLAPHQPGRRAAGRRRPGHVRASGEVHLLHRRERGSEPVATVPRGTWV